MGCYNRKVGEGEGAAIRGVETEGAKESNEGSIFFYVGKRKLPRIEL